MSYTISLQTEPCPTCKRRGDEPNCPDPTYNLSPIFDLALTGEPYPSPEVSEFSEVILREKVERPRGLCVLHGRVAHETAADLSVALGRLKDPALRPAFLALEPPNGWGDLPGAIKVMGMLLDLAVEYPDNTWEIY